MSSPIRIDDELYGSAKGVAELMSRSAAQQLAHWARIGRELERSTVSTAEIVAVLDGDSDYDHLGRHDQAIVRAAWDERASQLRGELDLAAEFDAQGRQYAELDADGNVVTRGPDEG